jgi:hypothetical protein
MSDGDEVKRTGPDDPRENDAGLGSREEAYTRQQKPARPALRLVKNEPKPRG